jgi:hypothetical protein
MSTKDRCPKAAIDEEDRAHYYNLNFSWVLDGILIDFTSKVRCAVIMITMSTLECSEIFNHPCPSNPESSPLKRAKAHSRAKDPGFHRTATALLRIRNPCEVEPQTLRISYTIASRLTTPLTYVIVACLGNAFSTSTVAVLNFPTWPLFPDKDCNLTASTNGK